MRFCVYMYIILNEMENKKNIKLRLRFERFSSKTAEEIKAGVDKLRQVESDNFKLNNAGNHIWLGIGMLRRELWSPTLHIELDKYEDGRTHVKGTFGPDPILWFVFLALHFVVAVLFVIFGIVAYSKWILEQSPQFDLTVMFLLVNVWFVLYFLARYNRKKGARQMDELLTLSEQLI